MQAQQPVYDFEPVEAVVNQWIRQRLAEEAKTDFGKIESCEVIGVPV